MSPDLNIELIPEQPRILIVDGSKVTRKLIESCLKQDLPQAELLSCASAQEAKEALQNGEITLVTTALRLPDMDGLELARHIREHAPQAYIPIIVVSGDAQERLVSRSFTDDVTDYFDKSLGFNALAAFIRGYARPDDDTGGGVLYVEDSRVVAVATRRMLEKHGLSVVHKTSAEDALEVLAAVRAGNAETDIDVVLTDVYLKGGLTGKELLERVRGEFGFSKSELPVLVMTGDDNLNNQTQLLRAGANDLVQKPIEERLLVRKLKFQLNLAHAARRTLSPA
jgi:CheY-like chemotaxis protein